ncbi:MAG: hypothetical protein HFI71_15345 [Lachnospiraceae bacterium]|nr:hypothetical protein [Lachnospiraceae bacterium]
MVISEDKIEAYIRNLSIAKTGIGQNKEAIHSYFGMTLFNKKNGVTE